MDLSLWNETANRAMELFSHHDLRMPTLCGGCERRAFVGRGEVHICPGFEEDRSNFPVSCPSREYESALPLVVSSVRVGTGLHEHEFTSSACAASISSSVAIRRRRRGRGCERDTWYTIRLSYDAAASGALKVRLYGSLEIDVTHTLAGTSVDEIQVSGPASPNQYFYDDFNIGDTADEPSYGQIVRLRATEAGNATQFNSVFGSSVHFENVDELPLPPVVDLDYNQHANNTSAQDLYGLFDFTSDSINAVKGMWRMARGNGGGVGTHDYICDRTRIRMAFPSPISRRLTRGRTSNGVTHPTLSDDGRLATSAGWS